MQIVISDDTFFDIFAFCTRKLLCQMELCDRRFHQLIQLMPAPLHPLRAYCSKDSRANTQHGSHLNVRKWQCQSQTGLFMLFDLPFYFIQNYCGPGPKAKFESNEMPPKFVRFRLVEILLDKMHWEEMCAALADCKACFQNEWWTKCSAANSNDALLFSRNNCKANEQIATINLWANRTKMDLYGEIGVPEMAWDKCLNALGEIVECSISLTIGSKQTAAELGITLEDDVEINNEIHKDYLLKIAMITEFRNNIWSIDEALENGCIELEEHRKQYIQIIEQFQHRLFEISSGQQKEKDGCRNWKGGFGPSVDALLAKMLPSRDNNSHNSKAEYGIGVAKGKGANIHVFVFDSNFHLLHAKMISLVERIYEDFKAATSPAVEPFILELWIHSYMLAEIVEKCGLGKEQETGKWTQRNYKSGEYLWICTDYSYNKGEFLKEKDHTNFDLLAYEGRMRLQRGQIIFNDNSAADDCQNYEFSYLFRKIPDEFCDFPEHLHWPEYYFTSPKYYK